MDMNLPWRKATYSSGNGGNCIEVATADRTVAVRDSKDPDGPRLAFGVGTWQAFAAKLKCERSLPSPLMPARYKRPSTSESAHLKIGYTYQHGSDQRYPVRLHQ